MAQGLVIDLGITATNRSLQRQYPIQLVSV